MASQSLCRQCGNDIDPSDKFCRNCGAEIVTTPSSNVPHSSQLTENTNEPQDTICPLCGHHNYPAEVTCESCGASLSNRKGSKRVIAATFEHNAKPTKKQPLTFFQSWKLTALLGIILIVVLIATRIMNKEKPPAGLSPKAATILKEIESLQKVVDGNPKEEQALLRLANLYYDMKVFQRAIIMYDRFLELEPNNANARVDMGIAYFQLALSDSTNRDEYFSTAKTEMERALTYEPKHQLAHFNLGMVNLHIGDFEKANEWFQKCAEIDSTTETGRKARALLKQHSFTSPS